MKSTVVCVSAVWAFSKLYDTNLYEISATFGYATCSWDTTWICRQEFASPGKRSCYPPFRFQLPFLRFCCAIFVHSKEQLSFFFRSHLLKSDGIRIIAFTSFLDGWKSKNHHSKTERKQSRLFGLNEPGENKPRRPFKIKSRATPVIPTGDATGTSPGHPIHFSAPIIPLTRMVM